MSLGQGGIERNGLPEGSRRARNVEQQELSQAEVEVPRRDVRPGVEGADEKRSGQVAAPCAIGKDAELLQGPEVAQ